MSRRPNTPATRTNPPDRDGDGAPGGSLPGNETVDAAKGPAPETAPPEAEAAPETAPDGEAVPPETAPTEGALTDPAAAGIETFLEGGAAEAAEAEATEATEAEAGDTFTSEEIAAGQTPVAEAEGETETTAAEATEAAQAELVAVEPEGQTAQPVAVRLDELRRLVDNRWLYRSADGFSPSYSGPYVSPETVQVWLDNGLAEDRPSAGREGGVYVTAKAKQAVAGRVAA